MKTTKKCITFENDNTDNITWYEDEYFQLVAPCYYSIRKIIAIVKRYNPYQKLILANILDNTGNYFIKEDNIKIWLRKE